MRSGIPWIPDLRNFIFLGNLKKIMKFQNFFEISNKFWGQGSPGSPFFFWKFIEILMIFLIQMNFEVRDPLDPWPQKSHFLWKNMKLLMKFQILLENSNEYWGQGSPGSLPSENLFFLEYFWNLMKFINFFENSNIFWGQGSPGSLTSEIWFFWKIIEYLMKI